MDSVLLVSLLAFLPLCLGVSPAWSLAGEEHGSKSHQGVLGSVVKEGGAFKYLTGSAEGNLGSEALRSPLAADVLPRQYTFLQMLSTIHCLSDAHMPVYLDRI